MFFYEFSFQPTLGQSGSNSGTDTESSIDLDINAGLAVDNFEDD